MHLIRCFSCCSDPPPVLDSLPCCPSPVLPSYHQDQAHTAVDGGSGPAGYGRGAPGPSRGSGGEGRTEAGAGSRSSGDSRSPRSTGPATRPGWTTQCCIAQKTKDGHIPAVSCGVKSPFIPEGRGESQLTRHDERSPVSKSHTNIHTSGWLRAAHLWM